MTRARGPLLVVGGGLAALGFMALTLWAVATDRGGEVPVLAFMVAAVGLPLAYLVTRYDPAYSLTAVVILSALSSNWELIGIPGSVAPNRLLLLVTVLAVVFKVGASRDRPDFKYGYVHLALVTTVVYVVSSSILAGNLTERASFFELFEAYGVTPFLTFLIAPIVFRDQKRRNVLLAGFVAFGVYLAITAVLERANLYGLVFPRYIADSSVGIHFGNARGPFVQATLNGFALYACAVAAAIAAVTWRSPKWRKVAAVVAAACLVATVLTFQRNVWLGVVIATIAALFFARGEIKRVAVGVGVVAAIGTLVVVASPSLYNPLVNQANDSGTIDDRVNANVAALNMIEADPLFGAGWDQWETDNTYAFRLGEQEPYSEKVATFPLHSSFLSHAVELGLVGFTLWLFTLLLAAATAIGRRSPPGDLAYWRVGMLAIVVFWIVTMNFTPPTLFPTFMAWLWIGVVWARFYDSGEEPAERPPAPA